MYAIEYAEGVEADLKALRAFDRSRVMDAIDAQLTHEPLMPTRKRKPLAGLIPPWDHLPPVWQLRVGDFRVFYDVDEAEHRVIVRAVRRKPGDKATEDIL